MLDAQFASNLADTIKDLRPLAQDDDFGAILAGLGEKLTHVLLPTEGRRAAAYSARAIELACMRDGVLDAATVALRGYMAARA